MMSACMTINFYSLLISHTLSDHTMQNSGVGTVAAVAALAATLFRPYINIHNLLSFFLWERG